MDLRIGEKRPLGLGAKLERGPGEGKKTRLRPLRPGATVRIGHPDPEFAMNFALFVVSAAAREAVLAGSLAAYPIEVGPERVVGELTRTFLAHLDVREA